MTHPAERRIQRIATDIGWLTQRIPQAITALETLAANGLPGTSDGRISGTAANTTVETAALSNARAQADLLDARTTELAGVVSELVTHLKGVPASVDPRLRNTAATEALRARCSGGEGEWADIHCSNLEVRPNHKSDLVRGVTFGLCWTCISRRRRWLAARDEGQEQAS